jgi:predicted Fe-S protein YdhL (DUF1289 family)
VEHATLQRSDWEVMLSPTHSYTLASERNRTMVESPCTSVCVLDDDICVGCGRTVSEIMNWQSMTEDDKECVVETIRCGDREYPKSE